MSKVLAINAGSSSLKFQLFEMPQAEVLCQGNVERIGLEQGIFTIKYQGEKHSHQQEIPNHKVAAELVLENLISHKIVQQIDEIVGVGHRFVHGGEVYAQSVIIDAEVIATCRELSALAPLHNPANITGYESFYAALPKALHCAVFDTAFHQSMQPDTFLYPIPYEYYTKYKVRRYGFHGTSHKYISLQTAKLMNKAPQDINVISCHLGNGASICAIEKGKSINTSMGFTPLAGVMMGTRSGDVDPSIITYLMEQLNLSAQEVVDIYNKKSGMLGVSGISSDARDIQDKVDANDKQAILTQSLYANRVVSVVGSYFAQLGHVDALVFTGGIGENDVVIRQLVLERLSEAMQLAIDYDLNSKSRGKDTLLSTPDSKVQVWLVATDEELMIAKDTYAFYQQKQ